MGSIAIQRAQDSAGLLRRMVVELDGVVVARLRPGASCTVSVPDGQHTLRARMDWTRSAPLELEIGGEGAVKIEVALGWRALVDMYRRPSSALEIRRI